MYGRSGEVLWTYPYYSYSGPGLKLGIVKLGP